MKTLKVISAILLALWSCFVIAQQGINYKALIKDSGGNIVANQNITVQFIIYEGAALTNNIYQETHSPMTDANGIVIVNIGEGTTSDDFTIINWGADDHYLNVQIDIGSGLIDIGTTQFMAVPYALSVSSESIKIDDLSDGKSDSNGSSMFLGQNAGDIDDGNNYNIAIGYNALANNTSGSENIAMGYNALLTNTTGKDNIAMGRYALQNNSTGYSNIAIGDASLTANSTGIENTATGYVSLHFNTTGNNNTALGSWTLFHNTTGSFNTANGASALGSNTQGTGNTANGYGALYLNSTGNYNTANGVSALGSNTQGTGNTANGYYSLFGNNGYDNVANGFEALFNNTTGSYNVSNGSEALSNNSTGSGNVGNGYRVLNKNTTGYENTANGIQALLNNTIGNHNVANGSNALYFNTTGIDNTAIGSFAGFSNSVGNGGVFIGNQAGYNETISNRLYIENSDANANNALIYGEFGTDNTTTGNILRTNSEFQIGNPTSTGYAFPMADGSINQILKTDGNGSLGWATSIEPTGLEALDEGNGIGWRLIGQNPAQYGNIGLKAVDLSMNSDTFEGATGDYSVAMGTSTHAYATYSTAIGLQTYASGYASTAMGSGTTASGKYSTAMGYGTESKSYESMAIGRFNIGGGNSTQWISTDPLFEIGNGTGDFSKANALTVLKNGTITAPSLTNDLINTAGARALTTKEYVDANASSGLEAIDEGNGIGWRLIGRNPAYYGNIGIHAVDLSYYNVTSSTKGATGSFSIAIGNSTTASGIASTAMGIGTTASGNYSTAMGSSTKAESFGSSAIGRYNIGGGTPSSWVATDPLFEIGIGTGPTSLANALMVLKNGNTSIGVNSPGSHKFYVKSNTGGVNGSTAFFENSSSTGLAMIVENTSISSTDNTLLVTTHGTGDIVSFDTYQGTNSWNRRFKFTNAGDGRCDGSWIGGGADYAEFFPKANNDDQYEPGDVIAMSPEIGYSVESANTDNPKLIIGVYSTNPVVVGNSSAEEDPKNHVLVGLMGVVPTKVNGENGPIKIGDFLTISSTPGVAMKATKSGYVIGRAMESFGKDSQGMIKVLVEPEWMDFEREIIILRKNYETLLKRVEQLELTINQ